jgi:hypothetical protein
VLGAALFPNLCGLGAAGSAMGVPKRIGVERGRSEGKPIGRSSGKTSNTAATSACKPNEVRVVQLRRERSVHQELRASANMGSSSTNAGKDTESLVTG